MTGLLAQATMILLAGCSLAGRRLGAYRRWWRRECAAQAAWQATAAPLWTELVTEVRAERHSRTTAEGRRPLYEALRPIERAAS